MYTVEVIKHDQYALIKSELNIMTNLSRHSNEIVTLNENFGIMHDYDKEFLQDIIDDCLQSKLVEVKEV